MFKLLTLHCPPLHLATSQKRCKLLHGLQALASCSRLLLRVRPSFSSTPVLEHCYCPCRLACLLRRTKSLSSVFSQASLSWSLLLPIPSQVRSVTGRPRALDAGVRGSSWVAC